MAGKVEKNSHTYRRAGVSRPVAQGRAPVSGDRYTGASVLGRGAGPSVTEVASRARAAAATPPAGPVTNPANGIMVEGGGIVFPPSFHPKATSAIPGCSQEQCAEWVHDTFVQAGKPLPFGGNGNQYWPSSAGVPGYTRIPNGSGQAPKPGDILCFGGGQYGHVAIVTQVSEHPPYVEVAQANWGSNEGAGVSHRFSWDPATGTVYSGDSGLFVQGFVRPDAAHSLLTPEQQAAIQQQALDPSQGAFDGMGAGSLGSTSQGSGAFSVPAGQTGGPSASSYAGFQPSAQLTSDMASAATGSDSAEMVALMAMLEALGIDDKTLDELAKKDHVPKDLLLAMLLQEMNGKEKPKSRADVEATVAAMGKLLKTPGHEGDAKYALQAYAEKQTGSADSAATQAYVANVLAYRQALDTRGTSKG